MEKNLFPKNIKLDFEKVQDLRYGENPHQKAAFYKEKGSPVLFRQLHGKELSFNNILDLDAAWQIVSEFKEPSVVIIKHNNPCGVASNMNLKKAFLDALNCDKLSAFGGIIGLNRKVKKEVAQEIFNSGFMEAVIAPSFDRESLKVLQQKKDLRIIERKSSSNHELDIKRVQGGILVQEKDKKEIKKENLKVVTKRKPTKKELENLLFAWNVVKNVKSNAIVLASGKKTIGIGAGQMSRVDSVLIAIRKAGLGKENKIKGSIVLASDAFFPKRDSVDEAAKVGVSAIIQPGGSIRDEESIKACDENNIAMVFTGIRHFKH